MGRITVVKAEKPEPRAPGDYDWWLDADDDIPDVSQHIRDMLHNMAAATHHKPKEVLSEDPTDRREDVGSDGVIPGVIVCNPEGYL